ncbi:tyrosine-type recombinase/integrase [Streptomyces sp. NPDC059752]|uniref:tyrosine-type recombinase/integrase n=1 Tax=unclassified Streptomyces TaxID=2593676 RepID=UPI0036604322
MSTGARASELLGVRWQDVDFGQQLVTVVRKGTLVAQQVPASVDALVWLRLYQEEIRRHVPTGRIRPVWWTLRRPYRPLTYHAAHRMFERANAGIGANWTLHDLRHTAAHRMARDPELPLTDVQWVLGHAHLSTTELYISPTRDEVMTSVSAFHGRQREQAARPPAPPAAGYRPESLQTLFGGAS